jgi:hypothetical protein
MLHALLFVVLIGPQRVVDSGVHTLIISPQYAGWCPSSLDHQQSNICGQGVIYIRGDLRCFFSDNVMPDPAHDGNYSGAAALQAVAWPYEDTAGGRLWYVYLVNVMNQKLAIYGSKLYVNVDCVR